MYQLQHFLVEKQGAIRKSCSWIPGEFGQNCRIRFQANSMFTLEKVLLRFKPTISSTIKHHTFPHATDLLNFSASARSRNVNLETGKQKLNSSCLKKKKKIKTVFSRITRKQWDKGYSFGTRSARLQM